MPMSDEQLDKAIDWVNQHTLGKTECKVCKNGTVGVHRNLVCMSALQDIDIKSSLSVPFIMAACRNCGHTSLFNAVTAGIV